MIVLNSHMKNFFKFEGASLFGKENYMVSYYVRDKQ
jgi:hypothetical protein